MELASLRDKMLKSSEYLFIILCGFHVAELLLGITTFDIQLPLYLTQAAFNLLVVTVCIRVICQIRSRLMIPAVIVGALYLFVWYSSYFRILALLTAGCVGINFRKLLRAYTAAAASVIMAAMIFAMSEGITDFVYLRNGALRSSMGVVYPTDYATIVLFILITVWVCFEWKPEISAVVLPAAAFFVSLYIADSHTSMICSAVFFVIIIYLALERRVISRRPELMWIRKTADIMATGTFPLCMLFVFVSIYCYTKAVPFSVRLNTWMHGRLDLAAKAFAEQHITPFGYAFEQIGAGGSVYARQGYNFIDSTYPRVLLMYGAVTLIVVCLSWVFLTHRAVKSDNRRMAFAMALIAIHSISEHHFIEFYYNIFLIMTFSSVEIQQESNAEVHEPTRQAVSVAVYTTVALIVFFLLPENLSCLSIWNVRFGDTNSGRTALLVAVVIIGWLIILMTRGLAMLIDCMICKCRPGGRVAAYIVPGVVILLIFGIMNAKVLKGEAAEYSSVIAADRDAVDVINESKHGKLYVSRIGKLYDMQYSGISSSLLSGEELARLEDTTVIVPHDRDSQVFPGKGFLYSRISDEHAIYTNDGSVSEALVDAGYHVAGYCYASHDAELEQKLDDIVVIPATDGKVHLDKDASVRAYNSHMNAFEDNDTDLFAGRYTATIRLSIPAQDYDNDYEVCRLSVSAYNGETVLRQTSVHRSWFDEDGRLDAKLVFSTGNYADVTFSADLTDADEMDILGISWQKTPVYDVRPTYGLDGLKTDEVWYDLSGNACMNRDGYAACSYEYNDNRSVTAIHYLGSGGKPVNIRYGYSDIIRIYDDHNRLIKEDHYDVTGALAATSDGYATTEWEYDKNGNASVIRYYDETHAPAVLKDGYSLVKREYDEEQRMTKETFCDANEKAVSLADQSSGTKRSYDEKGRLSSIVYIGQNGEPVQNTHGAFMIRRVYDNAGLTNEIYCDLMGNPVITDAGYSRRERLCDGAGRVWLYRYYTPDGSVADISQIQCDYDDNDVLTSISIQDKDGMPLTCSYGFSRAAFRYDKAGKLSTIDYYDEEGSAVSLPEKIDDGVRFLIL